MAKSPAGDSIMSPDKMKPLLALSKQEPVGAAIGLTADGEGLILLDKKAKPKKVASMLRASAAKAKLQLNSSSIRFGRAEVDTEYDSGMVRFFINKDAPGNLRVKLVEVVKRIPYQKVELNVLPSLEEESEEDDVQEQTAQDSTATAEAPVAAPPEAPPPPPVDTQLLRRELTGLIGRIAQVAGNDAALRGRLAQLAGAANEGLKANNSEAAAAAVARLKEAMDGAAPTAPQGNGSAVQPTAEALKAELAGLIGRIASVAGNNTGRRGQLATLAGGVNEALKSGNLNAATEAIAQLKAAMETTTGTAAANGTAALPVWTEAKDAVDGQLNQLYGVLKKAGLPALNEVADEIENVLERFRVGVITALMNYDRASGDAKTAARTAALKAVQDAKARLQSDKHVIAADTNPFGVTITARVTLGAALDKLSGQLSAT